MRVIHKPISVSQITGLATTFNSTDLKATIFLPKNEAFDALSSSLGLTTSQVFNSSSSFLPFLGQVRVLCPASVTDVSTGWQSQAALKPSASSEQPAFSERPP